jgi:hypothetical protein
MPAHVLDSYIAANADVVVEMHSDAASGLVLESSAAQMPARAATRVKAIAQVEHPLVSGSHAVAPGARVISINGTALDGMDAAEAQEFMLSAEYPLVIVIATRPTEKQHRE